MQIDYIYYKWNGSEDIIPYNVRADTFDTPYYQDMPYSLVHTIRFMAEGDIKDLIADGVHVMEIQRKFK